MADEEKKEVEEKSKSGSNSGSNLIGWIIIAVVGIVGSVGGFALAQLLGGKEAPPPPENPDKTEVIAPVAKEFENMINQNPDAKPWYYTLEPAVVGNLNEPGVTRYLRASITLELSGEFKEEDGLIFLEEKKVILIDWLTQYIAGLSLEDVRGTRNLGRIKNDIRDQFNTLLFPDSKPFVTTVFLKEFAVQ